MRTPLQGTVFANLYEDGTPFTNDKSVRGVTYHRVPIVERNPWTGKLSSQYTRIYDELSNGLHINEQVVLDPRQNALR